VTVLVDTNVLIDIAVRDRSWLRWSRRQLENARSQGPVVINQAIYAEFGIRYATPEEVDQVIPPDEIRREGIPWLAAFAASHAFLAYRRRGGRREKPLPDFFIGAHAAIRGYALLTRDTAAYRTYFPQVALICPETHP